MNVKALDTCANDEQDRHWCEESSLLEETLPEAAGMAEWLSRFAGVAEWRSWVSCEDGREVTHFVIRPHDATKADDFVLSADIHDDGVQSTCVFRFIELAQARRLLDAAAGGTSWG